jgi:hypothetical protein
MKGPHLKAWLTTLEEMPHPQRASNLFIVGWIALITLIGLSGSALAAQEPRRQVQPSLPQRTSSRCPQAVWSRGY